MKNKKCLFAAIAALALAGCAPMGQISSSVSSESAGSTTSSAASSSESSSSSTATSVVSDSASSSSSASSEQAPTIPEELSDNAKFKTLLDAIRETPIKKLHFTMTGYNYYETPYDEDVTYEFTDSEVLETSDGKRDYVGILDDVYYTVSEGSQSDRIPIKEDATEMSSDAYSPEIAQEYLDSKLGSTGWNRIFDYWDPNAGDPWYGGYRQETANITLKPAATANGYAVNVTAYSEDPTASYYYAYQAEFAFDKELKLIGLTSQQDIVDPKDWDAENHEPVNNPEAEGRVFIEVDEVEYGEVKADPANPLLPNLDSYYVSGIEGTPTLYGQNGYDDNGNRVFQVGDVPSLSQLNTFLPATALNTRSIKLTGASDPTALVSSGDTGMGTSYSFAKAGTFDLYFGDYVDGRIITVKDVEVFSNGPSYMTFDGSMPWAASTENGHEIVDGAVSIPLAETTDTVYAQTSWYMDTTIEFATDEIVVTSSNPSVLTASVGGKVSFDMMMYRYKLPIKLELKSLGDATITIASPAAPDEEMGTVSTITLAINVNDGEATVTTGGSWSDVESAWNASWLFSNTTMPCPPEPAFEYTGAEFSEGADNSAIITIYTAEENLDVYADALLNSGDAIPSFGDTPYAMDDVQPTDGSIGLNILGMLMVNLAYDSVIGAIVGTWVMPM